jgi:hypothetical protein
MAKYSYGRKFRMNPKNKNSTMVCYRYTNKKKSTKTLVNAKTRKIINSAWR